MTVAKTHDAYEQGETPGWVSPLQAFVEWLAKLLDYIARWKRIRRDHTFRPNWRDSWDDLRQCEWWRDQVTAHGLRQLFNGEDLRFDAMQIVLDPPAGYGGPCPRTPFEMNRRFIAIAQWRLDPEALVRKRFARFRISVCPLRRAASPTLQNARGNRRRFPPPRKARGRWHARACVHAGGGGRRHAFSARPRAPPAFFSRQIRTA